MVKKFFKAVYAILIFVGITALFASIWYISVYGEVGFDSIIFTLFGNMGGVESGLVKSYIFRGLIPSAVLTAVVCLIVFYNGKRGIRFKKKKSGKTVTLYPFPYWLVSVLSVVLSITLICSSAYLIGFFEWAEYSLAKTEFYEENYVFPEKTNIKFPEKKRNLIYIVLESMETTYFSKERGGAMDVNLIPELYNLAKNNVNFSQNSSVGGWSSTPKTSWTIASIVAQTSGLVVSNDEVSNTDEGLLPGATTLMDVLNDNGYYQAFMVGSDADFGGRKSYFLEHGCDKVYDLFTAREDNIVPKNYYEWWGIEDKYLYTYAKQEILKMADNDEPFAFTMLTVDTHSVGGYVCSECKTKHSQQYSNVVSCASRQLYSFINWLKEQDFYDNTTIVICGDHQSMDSEYFKENVDSTFERRVYNCFINTAVKPIASKNRVFTPLDMFPTILGAMGCEIEGDRLALGTNLFSKYQTLAEINGKEVFGKEIQKKSVFYDKNFLKRKDK